MESTSSHILASVIPTTIKLPDNVFFEPKEDITAYELAQAMPILLRMAQGDWNWNYPQDLIPTLPEGVQRHFRLEPARR